MKFYLLICVCVLVVKSICGEVLTDERAKEAVEYCLKNTAGATAADLTILDKISNLPKNPTTTQYCLFACVQTKLGYLDGNKMDIEKLIKENPTDTTLFPALRACGKDVLVDKNPCVTAEKFLNCMKSKVVAK